MKRVDFYLLGDHNNPSRDQAVCRIANKVFQLGHSSFILTADREESARLDRLLWTFNPGSFIPHRLNTAEDLEPVPVLIGHEGPDPDQRDVLFSLRDEIPDSLDAYQRIVEVIGPSEEEKNLARDRYRRYKDQGYELHTHDI